MVEAHLYFYYEVTRWWKGSHLSNQWDQWEEEIMEIIARKGLRKKRFVEFSFFSHFIRNYLIPSTVS